MLSEFWFRPISLMTGVEVGGGRRALRQGISRELLPTVGPVRNRKGLNKDKRPNEALLGTPNLLHMMHQNYHVIITLVKLKTRISKQCHTLRHSIQ